MKKYNSNYLGIVVQNNDPEFRGRIKVWVPHISVTVYNNWNQTNVDKRFKFPGGNIETDLTKDILDKLKDILPWAEYCSPIMGGSSSATYKAYDDQASISDTNREETNNIPSEIFNKYNFNTSQSPGKLYEPYDLRVNDAFNDTEKNNTNQINQFSYNYTPSTYSNSAKGTFSIPNVGAHVWVFFREGDPSEPVYFGNAFGQDDFWSIFNPDTTVDNSDQAFEDYPQTYENYSLKDRPNRDHNTDTYRNKFVFNQKGGTFEIVNTDQKELLKMTHYSGAFFEFNNRTSIYFSPNNNQKLVLQDQFETVKGNNNSFTNKNLDQIVKGDYYKKIGHLKKEPVQSWYEIVKEFADIKSQFEIGRLEGTPVSLLPSLTFPVINNVQSPLPGFNMNIVAPIGPSGSLSFTSGPDTAESRSTFNQSYPVNTEKLKLINMIENQILNLSELELQMGQGGNEYINIAKHKIETIGLHFNDLSSFRIDPVGKVSRAGVGVNSDVVYDKLVASPVVEYVHVDDLPGGNYSLTICNKFNVNVGAGGIRLKTLGNFDIMGGITNVSGKQVNIASDNEVNIDGGKRVGIEGDVVTLKQRNGGQIGIDGNLGVTHNVIIGGGALVEGELFVQHITAPGEVHETETNEVWGEAYIGSGSSSGVWPVKIFPHNHRFHGIASTLVSDSNQVRSGAQALDTNANDFTEESQSNRYPAEESQNTS